MKERQDDEISLQGDSQESAPIERTICKIPRGTFFVCGTAVLLAIAVIIVSVFMMHSALPNFHEALLLDDVMVHLEELQAIATSHKGSRGLLHGYNASVDYFEEILATEFEVERQEFPVNAYKITQPSTLEGILEDPEADHVVFDATEFRDMLYSGSGEVTGPAVKVNNYGCDIADYPTGTTDPIFVVPIGDCSLPEKATVAHKAGGKAVLISTNDIAFSGSLGHTFNLDILVLVISKSLSLDILYLSKISTLRIAIHSVTYPTVAWNLLATTTGGSETDVIVVGSHLDSVDNGPGINDNGSGAAALLNMAVAYKNWEAKNKNKVVFAFWGAEENGQVGSNYYVSQLKKKGQLPNIAVYLNMAILASPNYIRGVYNATEAPSKIREACKHVQTMFTTHFEDHKMESDLVTFDGISGLSDSAPFLTNNIPAGGVTAGAESLKTMEERAKYGGIANVALDPCFHHKCDSIENVNKDALDELMRGAARVVYDLSMEASLRETLGSS